MASNWFVTGHGDLVVEMDEVEREDFLQGRTVDEWIASRDYNYDAYVDAMEELWKDDYDWVNPAEVGALTSSPLLGYDVVRDDNGELTSVKRVYAYNMYAIRSPVEDLLRYGRVVWQGYDVEPTDTEEMSDGRA